MGTAFVCIIDESCELLMHCIEFKLHYEMYKILYYYINNNTLKRGGEKEREVMIQCHKGLPSV